MSKTITITETSDCRTRVSVSNVQDYVLAQIALKGSGSFALGDWDPIPLLEDQWLELPAALPIAKGEELPYAVSGLSGGEVATAVLTLVPIK